MAPKKEKVAAKPTPPTTRQIEGEQTITLPLSGATVKLRDYKTLKYKDRRRVWASMNNKASEEGQPATGVITIEAVMALIILEWSFLDPSGEPVPVPSETESPEDSLGELDNEDFEYLLNYAHDANTILFGGGFAKTLENQKDKDSPLDNLNESKES